MSKFCNLSFVPYNGAFLRSTFCVYQRGQSTAAAAIGENSYIKPVDAIPGHKSFPIIGTSWTTYPFIGKYKITDIGSADLEKYNKFGDIVKDRFGSQTLISVFNLEDIQTVVKNESKTPNRGLLLSMGKYRESRKELYKNTGVLFQQGQEWYNLRFKLQRHLMKPRTVDRYVGPMTDIAHALINRLLHLRDGNLEVPNTLYELFKWSFESVSYFGLHKRMGTLELQPNSEAVTAIKKVQESFYHINKLETISGSSIQLWKWFPTPTYNKMVRAMDYFTEIAFKEVQRALDELRTFDGQNTTMLQDILTSKDIEPHEAMTMVVDMLFAGIETTSNAAAFTLYELARNPEKQEILYQEIRKLLPSRTQPPTADILNNLRYLKLCIKEALRLHPIARGIFRILDRDLVLSGYHIPKGTMCFLSFQTCARLEKYFENPNAFIPERWDSKESRPSPYAFIPFGFGTRSCIGRRIAELELNVLITEILRRFRVEYRYDEIKMYHRMVNTPDRELKFAFIERN